MTHKQCCYFKPLAKLTVFGHSNFETFLESAVLASISGHLVDYTLLVTMTRVLHVLLYTPPKETLSVKSKQYANYF